MALKTEEKGTLPVIKRGKGPYLYDYDGNRYVDFSLDRGALVLGHSPAKVSSVLKSWLGRGFGDDPATASLTVSHQTLSRRLWDTIWEKREMPDMGQWIFIYSTSPLEAMSCAMDLMGKKGITVTNAVDGPERRIASRLSSMFHLEDAAAPEVLANGGEGNALFSDETELLFHVSVRRHPEILPRLAGRIVGSWAAAGLPFGCVVMKASLVEGESSIERVLPSAGSLPLCLVKAVSKSIDLREGCGGIAGLLEKQGEFFSALGGKFFDLRDGFVFVRERGKPPGRYRELRERALREGILFPVSHLEPLSLSFAHDGALLLKCARQIVLLFDIFYR